MSGGTTRRSSHRPSGSHAATPTWLNHAGTSWPKPAGVASAMERAVSAPPHVAAEQIETTTEKVAGLLGCSADRVLLTPGCTSALAIAIDDLPWREGDVVVTGSMEHHALLRPIERLVRTAGVRHIAVGRDSDGPLDVAALETLLAHGGVRLVAMTMAANVTGEILPAAEIVRLAHEHGATVLLDAAQTAGVVPIDLRELEADMLALAGHKGPLGPMGVGALYIGPGVERACTAAVCEIGTAPGASADAAMPGYCDAGGAPLPAIAGLGAAIDWLQAQPAGAILERGRARIGQILEALQSLPAFTVHGHSRAEDRVPTLSVTHQRIEPSRLEATLLEEYGIVSRSGLHCAPQAHRTLGTDALGTLRVSFGAFSEDNAADRLIAAFGELDRA
jgi:cysteine desulfurase/selenocysteine lyase